MTWDGTTSERQLHEAIRTFDQSEVAHLCGELVASVYKSDAPYPARNAKEILQALRRGRHFQQLQQVADAFLQCGRDEPLIRTLYAQSLIDQGNLSAAVGVLEPLRRLTADTQPRARHEIAGLLGRAYKQMYVATGRAARTRMRRYMAEAVQAYHRAYAESADALWHGINIVALLDRANRDQITFSPFDMSPNTVDRMANGILEAVEKLDDRATTWDLATAVEACVALERPNEASSWLGSYLARPETDAFEIASTLRQLTEVWELSAEHEPGRRLIPMLQAELLRRQGGEVEIGAGEISRDALARMDRLGLERVFGPERFTSLTWFRDALQRCRAVARIEERVYRDGIGTGFLVEGRQLRDDFPDVVLVTNAHVLGDANQPTGKHPDALDRDAALVTFRALEPGGACSEYHVTQVLWSSPPSDLDTSIGALDAVPSDITPLPLATQRPRFDTDAPPRTYIIGHPQGMAQPMFSIRDNLLLDADDTRVHYRTPTLGGSSGSPVFNSRWEVIALHHGGGEHMRRLNGKPGVYAANEGIWLERIRAALAAVPT
jgi:hypothetical protein